MSVAVFSCGGVAMCYVLRVLWMTSYLHIMGHRPMQGACVTLEQSSLVVQPLAVPIAASLNFMMYCIGWCKPAAKSAVCDCQVESVNSVPVFSYGNRKTNWNRIDAFVLLDCSSTNRRRGLAACLKETVKALILRRWLRSASRESNQDRRRLMVIFVRLFVFVTANVGPLPIPPSTFPSSIKWLTWTIRRLKSSRSLK